MKIKHLLITAGLLFSMDITLSAGYNPETGRFLNRDPAEENGGVNLYAFNKNDAINKWDFLGLLSVNRDSKEDFACVNTENGDSLDTLSTTIGMEKNQALGAKGWLYTKKDGTEHAASFSAGKVYYIPNIWITANLMHGGDIIDTGIISWGGLFGWSYKPEGAKEVSESNVTQLPSTIANNAGKIYGLTMYAHGDKLGFITNSANWLWGNADYIHTMDVLRALDVGGYKIAEAHPMQCYSVYKGKASTAPLLKNNPNPNGWDADAFRDYYRIKTGLLPIGAVTGSTESVLYYQVDWLGEWEKRAKKVNGYSGTNIIGIDF